MQGRKTQGLAFNRRDREGRSCLPGAGRFPPLAQEEGQFGGSTLRDADSLEWREVIHFTRAPDCDRVLMIGHQALAAIAAVRLSDELTYITLRLDRVTGHDREILRNGTVFRLHGDQHGGRPIRDDG